MLYPAFIKRDAFSHEKEVRLVLCERMNGRFKNLTKDDGIKLSIDFCSIINKIILDPRLDIAEVEFYTRGFEKYRLTVEQSQLYNIPELSIENDKNSSQVFSGWKTKGDSSIDYLKTIDKDEYNKIEFLSPNDDD